MSLLRKIIPRQVVGSKTGSSAKFESPSPSDAKTLFIDAKHRLQQINSWYLLCAETGAEFQLTDDEGNALETGPPDVGNLIRIKLPAPPNKMGDGYDWVRVEKLEELEDTTTDEQLFGFRVRPIDSPYSRTDARSHFYTSEATSTFVVYRKSNVIEVLERGRKEVPNVTGNFLDKLRNLVVAIPAMLGFSKPQWQHLVNGILNPPKY
jgi:hypothetical protein